MEPRAVRRYVTPDYPTGQGVRADPRLIAESLRSSSPKRAGLAGLAAALIGTAAVGGCRTPAPTTIAETPAKTRPPPPAPVAARADPLALRQATAPASAPERSWPEMAVCAPIFQHGRGFKSMIVGLPGIVLNPQLEGCPVPIPEDDALRTIRNQLAEGGVHLTRFRVDAARLILPNRDARIVVQLSDEGEYRAYTANRRRVRALRVDGVDPRRGVAVEFVSHRDMERFGYQHLFQGNYDYRRTAGWLAKHVDPTGSLPLTFVFFYDPGEPTRKAARAQLRSQVSSFLRWLERWERVNGRRNSPTAGKPGNPPAR